MLRPPRSVWFGPPSAPLFGRFHPAEAAQAKNAVVVLCNPFGYDAQITHYAQKKLAERLSAAGIAALRFDYYGTGDSAGEDEGADRLEAWLRSIAEAVKEARRLSGAGRVILFGLRLGALLAGAAAAREPVDGLVLFGPPRTGAAYLRELNAINKLRSTRPGVGASPDIEVRDDESLGFALPDDLRAAIAAIDLTKGESRPARRALVIGRDDLPGAETKLVEHLRARDVDVEHAELPGYAALFLFKPMPPETADAIIRFIGDERLAPSADPPAAAAASWDGITEEAAFFDGLFGIVTEPAAPAPTRQTGILLLGTGANVHIGVNRMSVTLARTLAKRGFRVLRFDLSGIGESPTLPGLPDRDIYTAQALFETREAISFMIARGAAKVALLGVCSGGYTAFHTAVRDERVVALAPANVPGFHYNRADSYGIGVDRPSSARVLARAAVSLVARSPLGKVTGGRLKRFSMIDDPDDVARAFGKLSARGCRTLLVNGTGDISVHSIQLHMGPALAKVRGDQNVKLAFVNGADHIFSPRVAQARLRELYLEFCETLR